MFSHTIGSLSISTLLVGMQTGAVTVENSMEFPQKTKDGTAFQSSDPTAGILNHQIKRTYTPLCSEQHNL